MAQTQVPAIKVQAGDTIPDPSSTTRYPGDICVLGSIPFPVVPPDPNLNGVNTLAVTGVYSVPKDTSTFTAGDSVYWNTTANPVNGTAGTGAAVSTASGAYLMGMATADAATGLAYVSVFLTAARRTTTIGGAVTAASVAAEDASLDVTGLQAAQGGLIAVTGGTSTTTGNAGGAVNLLGGTPGATGIGGAVTIAGAAGGSSSGAGGAVSIAGGAGTATNSAGGAVTVVGGVGSATNAAGGLVSNTGGAGAGSSAGGLSKIVGGLGGATGAGGAAQVTGGAGGSSSGTGGAATIAGGAATGSSAVGGAATITGGASAGASGTAGAAGIDAGAATGGTGAPVLIGDVNASSTYINRGPLKAPIMGLGLTALGTTQSSAPTIAQLLGGVITQSGTSAGGVVTLPTGTAISTGMARTPVTGDSFRCVFQSITGGQILTITGATGSTVVGNPAVGVGKVAILDFINTGTNAWTCFVTTSA